MCTLSNFTFYSHNSLVLFYYNTEYPPLFSFPNVFPSHSHLSKKGSMLKNNRFQTCAYRNHVFRTVGYEMCLHVGVPLKCSTFTSTDSADGK